MNAQPKPEDGVLNRRSLEATTPGSPVVATLFNSVSYVGTNTDGCNTNIHL